ncbi:MAG: ABC transporter substrate-binding protein [Chloroflexi bacterium]|nr:ABC transporter substrate-binding protein [Chloroflexota bacterium]
MKVRLTLLMLLLAALMVACAPADDGGSDGDANTSDAGESDAGEDTEVVEISYMYPGTVPDEVDLVEENLNEILVERINTRVDLQPLDWGQFDERATLMLTTGEQCDIVFTANWLNNYWQRVNQGSFIPLDDLLDEHAPETRSAMAEQFWDAVRVNGEIYGVPNRQIWTRSYGVVVDQTLADQVGFDTGAVDELGDLEPYLEAVVDEVDIPPIYTDDLTLYYLAYAEFGGYDPQLLTPYVVVKADDPNRQAVNFAETPEFEELVTLAYNWNQAGYMAPEPPPADVVFNDFLMGNYPFVVDVVTSFTDESYESLYSMEEATAIQLVDPFVSTNAATGTISSICSTSEHPEQAMQFINLMNTDPEVFNIVAYGVEGVHWNWIDEENLVIEQTEQGLNGYNPSANWVFGNSFLGYMPNPALAGSNEDAQAQNDAAFASSVLGFAVDTEPINTEIAQVQAVIDEFGGPLTYGLVEPTEGIPELVERMNEAGMQTILEEVQRQIDEWAASR